MTALVQQVPPVDNQHFHHLHNAPHQPHPHQQQMQPPQHQMYHQQHHHHHQNHHKQQQQPPHAKYTAAIPVFPENTSNIPGMQQQQANVFKQINVIPGLDAENALVDTGIKIIRQLANQVQVSSNTATANEFDGKRMRRSIQRRTVDYNSSTLQTLKHRMFRRSILQKPVVQPDPLYYTDLVQPKCILENPINSVTTRFVRASTNKIRCPVFTVAWTPEGRRVVTGTSSGEFTLWNGLTFNFETILQAHESAVRAMEWSHNDMWLLSGDHNGVIKYWQSNMNNVKMIQAHSDPIRGLSFCPTDNKFVTCSDDGTIKLWDFYRCVEERTLKGHGAEVKCIGWHPSKCMLASGSKDSQQPLKLWDPRTSTSLATIHAHKSTVMDLDWNKNGNWLLTGSRDRLLKVFDIRMMKELYTFRGHKREAASVNWHPLYEGMFASGGSDGSILFWLMGSEKEIGVMDHAHDGMIWDLKWHPLGHILCSASNDHTTKFWTRNRPGDKMRDKYNLNILPTGFEDDYEYEIPNTSQPDGDSQINDTLNSSMMSTDGPCNGTINKSDLDIPVVKALLESATLEVSKPTVKETPAQIYTVNSNLRPNAPTFTIDCDVQQEALDEVDKIEKHRERQLRGRLNDDPNAVNAPSLLDLEITKPDFLKDLDWDNDSEEPPPFIEDLKRRNAERIQAEQEKLHQQQMEMQQQMQQQQQNNPQWQPRPPQNSMPPPHIPPSYNGPPPSGHHQPHGGPPSHPNGAMNGNYPDNRRPFDEPSRHQPFPDHARRDGNREHGNREHGNDFMAPPPLRINDRRDNFSDKMNNRPPHDIDPRQIDRNGPNRDQQFYDGPPPSQRFNEPMEQDRFSNGPPNRPPYHNNENNFPPPPPQNGRFNDHPPAGDHPPPPRWEDQRLSDRREDQRLGERWQDERIGDR